VERHCWTLTKEPADDHISLNIFLLQFLPIDSAGWIQQLMDLNLHLAKTPILEVKRALSYRHFHPLKLFPDTSEEKSLAKDALDFLLWYSNFDGDIEGLWIDCLCIAPCGQSLSEAFDIMGDLFRSSLVIPFWLFQENIFDGFDRAWIFQESRFTRFDIEFLQKVFDIIPMTEDQLFLMSGLIRARDHHIAFQGKTNITAVLSFFDELPDVTNFRLSKVFHAYLTSTITKEEQLNIAIFGVLQAAGISDLSTMRNGPILRINGELQTYPVEVKQNSLAHERLVKLFPLLRDDNLILLYNERSSRPPVLVDYCKEKGILFFGWSDFSSRVFTGMGCSSIMNDKLVTSFTYCRRSDYFLAMIKHFSKNPDCKREAFYFPENHQKYFDFVSDFCQ
jgi:hypothetical protein